MCLTGKGGTVNIGHGEYWLNIAASRGNSRAQAFLGQCYFEGQFFAQDIDKGKYWLTVAATNGDESAGSYLSEIIKTKTINGVSNIFIGSNSI